MDPAKPLFPYKWKNERLSEQDAQFVDIVHTTKLILGQSKPLGNIDFYPNKNYTIQPGCNFGEYARTKLILLLFTWRDCER